MTGCAEILLTLVSYLCVLLIGALAGVQIHRAALREHRREREVR